jgi:hypothetical protein
LSLIFFSLDPVRIALQTAFVLMLLGLLVVGPIAVDTLRDRQHRVIITDTLNVYQTSEPPWREHSNPVVASVTPNDSLKVLRIRYGKDYMVVRVKLPNGQQGYIFYGDSFRLYSPDGSKV